MALADVEKARIPKGPPCMACQALHDLRQKPGGDVEADALLSMMGNRRWRYSEISAALLSEHQVDLPAFSIGRHARGECAARTKLRGA